LFKKFEQISGSDFINKFFYSCLAEDRILLSLVGKETLSRSSAQVSQIICRLIKTID